METPMNSGMGMSMGSPSKLPTILVTVLITAVVIIAGMYAFGFARSGSDEVVVESVTPMPTAIPTESTDTIGWKTYTNTQYGYELQYPSNFPDPRIGRDFSVSYYPDISGQVAIDYYTDLRGFGILEDSVPVAGLTAHKFKVGGCIEDVCGDPGVSYILLWRGHPLVILFLYDLAKSNQVNKILSTFRFTK